MNGIYLHPEYGVNPTMPVCIVCNEDKGTIALLGRAYNGEAPMHMVMDIEPCDTCRKKYLKTGTLLVEFKEKSVRGGNAWSPTVDKHMEPTGRLVVIKDEAFERLFGQKVPKGKIAKVEFGLLDMLEAKATE